MFEICVVNAADDCGIIPKFFRLMSPIISLVSSQAARLSTPAPLSKSASCLRA
jgi:hypothetical protein